jgi:hypothetical protein
MLSIAASLAQRETTAPWSTLARMMTGSPFP